MCKNEYFKIVRISKVSKNLRLSKPLRYSMIERKRRFLLWFAGLIFARCPVKVPLPLNAPIMLIMAHGFCNTNFLIEGFQIVKALLHHLVFAMFSQAFPVSSVCLRFDVSDSVIVVVCYCVSTIRVTPPSIIMLKVGFGFEKRYQMPREVYV